jgi:DNA-binding transcriptional LysR family regulator
MDTQHLRTFIEVVRQGGFAAAARRLDLGCSQVSRAVTALEAELGARLMHRTTRKLTLTEWGAAYFRRVSELMNGLDEASDDVRASTSETRGLIRLTASMALGKSSSCLCWANFTRGIRVFNCISASRTRLST